MITSDEQWRQLIREAGWRVSNPSGLPEREVAEWTRRLQNIARSRDHDSILVWFPENYQGDILPDGRGIETLRNVFDVPQLVGFGEQAQPAPAPRAAKPGRPVGEPAPAYTARGTEIDTQPEVVELSDLIASHGLEGERNQRFPAELQPRERARAASREQIREMGASLRPELLGTGQPSAAEGAPIIGPDNIVESGNARVLALRSMTPEGRDRYRDFLRQQGADISGFREPVLVRRRTTPLDQEGRRRFVREANEAMVSGMSAAEKAAVDAEQILSAHVLELYQPGDLTTVRNQDFVRAFMERVPAAERAQLMTATGQVSQEGVARIENALWTRAYSDTDILAGVREATDAKIVAISKALIDVAPQWAQLRAGIDLGEVRGDMAPTDQLLEAVRTVDKARRQGVAVFDVANQADAFGRGLDDLGLRFLRLMFHDDRYRRPVARERLGGALNDYVRRASEVSDTAELLELDLPKITPEAILDTLIQPATARTEQGDLLGAGGGATRGMAAPRAAGPGVNYIRLLEERQKFDPDAPRREDPARREAILADLTEALGVPLYQGRVKGRRLGFFRPGAEEVRIKKRADLEVTAHEIAHLLDDRVPEIRRQWKPATKANKEIRDELRGVSYDRKKLYEGFAEFVRLWMTQPCEASRHAPKFTAWFEDLVERSEYGPTLKAARDQMLDWFGQNKLDAARSKFDQAEDINAWTVDRRDAFRQAVMDDLWGIARAEIAQTGRLAENGMYQTARLERGKAGVLQVALNYGAPQWQGNRLVIVDAEGQPVATITPDGKVKWSADYRPWGLEQILKPVAHELEEFGLYAVGRRADHLRRQGRENLFTKAEIEAMLSLEKPSFVKAFEDWNTFNKQLLDFAEQSGLIDPVARAKWETDVYLPFYRVDRTSGRARDNRGNMKVVYRLKGGTGNLGNPVTNMYQNTRLLVEASITNNARRIVVDGIKGQPGSARFLAKVAPGTRSVQITKDQFERQFWREVGTTKGAVDAGQVPEGFEEAAAALERMPEWLRVYLMAQQPTGANVIATMSGGKPTYYEVADPLLLRALEALPRRPYSGPFFRLVNFFRGVRTIGQLTVTAAPDFVARNMIRDQAMALALSRHGYKPFVDAVRGIKQRVRHDPAYVEWLANGGAQASFWGNEIDFHRHMRTYYERHGIAYNLVINTPRKMLYTAQRIADAGEVGTRIGAFQRAIRRGVSPQAAAFEAREISTDFGMRGDNTIVNLLYDTVIFLKAGVVGVDRTYRGFSHDPRFRARADQNFFGRHRAATVTAGIAAATVFLWAMNRTGDVYELYDELEDWDRDMHWHIFVPKLSALEHYAATGRLMPVRERYHHFRIPKPWEIGGIATITERALEGVVENEPEQMRKMARVVREMFRYEFIPQALVPLYEQATNRLTFFDRPIEPVGVQDELVWSRATPYTSRTLRWYGENIARHYPDWLSDTVPDALESPARLEALLRGYFNAWATYGLTISDSVFFDDLPALRIDQYPGLRPFYRQEPATSTRYLTEFYDMVKEATEARRTMRTQLKRQRPDIAEELVSTPENLMYGPLTAAQEAMQNMRRQTIYIQDEDELARLQEYATSLRSDPSLRPKVDRMRLSSNWRDLPALKRELIDLWIGQRNALAKEVVQNVQSAGGVQ